MKKAMTADEMEKRARAHLPVRLSAIDRHPLKEQIMECLRRKVPKNAIQAVLREEKAPVLTESQLRAAAARMRKGKA